MIEKIKSALGRKKVTGWQIRESVKTSHQSFLAKTEREAARSVETVKYIVSIFQKRTESKGDVLGMSSFVVSPENAADLEKNLDEALFAATLVSNQPFELCEQPTKIPVVEIADASVNQSSLKGLEDRLLAAVQKEKQTRLSYAEFFATRVRSRLLNHRGLDLSQEETVLHTEFVLLSSTGTRENEFIDRYSRRFLSDFNLEHEVAESAQYAREATTASLPKTGRFPVILSDEPLDQLFNPLVARASARLKYNRMLDVEKGKSVSESPARGDSITLWSNSTLPRATGSFAFDSYGVPAQRICLIEKNTVKNLLADKRYADYLSVPLTGELGNIEVEPGKHSLKELADPGRWGAPLVYQLQAFSAFEPNPITGAFSAEIRAGYEISPNGVRPIKGGSVSGVLQKDLAACFLSSETAQRERCLVPKGVLFERLDITGD